MTSTPLQDGERTRISTTSLRMLGVFMRPYRGLFLRLGLIMAVFAVLDSAIPLLSRRAIDDFAVQRRTSGLAGFAALCGLFALVRGLSVWCMIVTGGRIYAWISCDIRRRCFAHLQALSFTYFDRNAVGWIMSRLTSDIQQLVRLFAWGIVDLVDGVGKLLLMSVIMLILDVRLALVVFAVVPPMVLVIWRFQGLTLDRFRGVRKATGEMTAAFNEGIMGARTSKTLGREAEVAEEFTQLTGALRDLSVSAARTSGLYLPLVLLVSSAGCAFALWVGGNGVIAGRVTYGTLVAFVAYAVSFFEPMKELARRVPMLQTAQAAAERILGLLETAADVADSRAEPKRRPQPFVGRIEIDGVSFAYVPEERVIQDLSLAIDPGETVALVGDTGAGKTTLVNLLCRFYKPLSGVIRIDGADYRDLPLSWLRQHLAIVQQTPYLFRGTVAENIRYGRPDAGDEDVVRAAVNANADAFIRSLPGGYGFAVGGSGDNLSSGQKQLVALARVVLADPGILILDEATSAVDADTERLVQRALGRVLAGRTSVIIAHRLSTIRRADRIVLLRHGRIEEEGTHQQLLARRGAYHRLYSSQFIAEQETRILC